MSCLQFICFFCEPPSKPHRTQAEIYTKRNKCDCCGGNITSVAGGHAIGDVETASLRVQEKPLLTPCDEAQMHDERCMQPMQPVDSSTSKIPVSTALFGSTFSSVSVGRSTPPVGSYLPTEELPFLKVWMRPSGGSVAFIFFTDIIGSPRSMAGPGRREDGWLFRELNWLRFGRKRTKA